MPIQAVSSVRNNGYVNFEGRKKEKSQVTTQPVANSLKAVPVALLLAMSPMVNAQDYQKFNGPNDREVVRYDCSKIDDNRITSLSLVSTDGDETPERADLYRITRCYTRENVAGKGEVPCHYIKTERIHVESLVECDVTSMPLVGNGETRYKEYYVRGKGDSSGSVIRDNKTNEIVNNRTYVSKIKDMEMEISKDLFDELNALHDGEIPIIKEAVKRVYDDRYDY